MKKKVLSLLQFSLLFAAVGFTGCKKLIDQYFPGHGPGGDDSGCRITQIVQGMEEGGPSRTGNFYYSGGQLDSIIFDMPTAAAQLHYFDYDSHHRLTGYRTYYDSDPANYYFLHKYVYSDAGVIIGDTAWIREAGVYTQVSAFDYDSKGRIVKESRKVIEADGQPTDETEEPILYEYDSNGNLQWTSGLSYDDKPSLLTSKVLRFTERNYSKNNPSGATGYNDQGLPLGFVSGSMGGLLQMGLPGTITYQCND